jgi:hypothetical protein
MSILMILFVVAMFLWFLSALPWPPLTQFNPASWILAFISVLILGIVIFAGGAVIK